MSAYEVDYSRQIPVYPGYNYVLLMPFSEVCDHMRIAGTVQSVLCKENGVYLDDGRGPHLTHGEAGIYTTTGPCPFTGKPSVTRYAYGMKFASDPTE